MARNLSSQDLNSRTRSGQFQPRSFNEGEFPIDFLQVNFNRATGKYTLTVKDGIDLKATLLEGIDIDALKTDYPA